MRERKEELAGLVALETGKSRKDALGEVGAAIEMGFFIAGRRAPLLRSHHDQRGPQPDRP